MNYLSTARGGKRFKNEMTAHMCALAQNVSLSPDNARRFINKLNDSESRTKLWHEMQCRSSKVDRISNLLALHRAFMYIKEAPGLREQLHGVRSAELFFIRLAARYPEKVRQCSQEICFTRSELRDAYRHLGRRVGLHARLGRMSICWSPQHDDSVSSYVA